MSPTHAPSMTIQKPHQWPHTHTTSMPQPWSPTIMPPTTVSPPMVSPPTVSPPTVSPTTISPTTVSPTTISLTTVYPTMPLPWSHYHAPYHGPPFFCATILFLAPSYITLYTWRVNLPLKESYVVRHTSAY